MYYRFRFPDTLLTINFRVTFAPLASGKADTACLMLVSTTLSWSGMALVDVREIPAFLNDSGCSTRWAYKSSSWGRVVSSMPVFSGPASLLAMPKIAGPLEEIYS